MIHHELGYTYALGLDGPEAVDMRTARDVLLATEDAPAAPLEGEELSGAYAMSVRVQALRGALAWILEAGPHPREVALRLVACTQRYAPRCLLHLPAREVAAITAPDMDLRHLELMRALLGQPRLRHAGAREHGDQINSVLAKAHRRAANAAFATEQPSDVDALARADTAGDVAENAVHRATLRRWCSEVWQAGPDLVAALKHFYVIARSYAPERLLNMTCEEVGSLFGQLRATTSAREKNLINLRQARAGIRHTTLRGQKSPAACQTYAARARGNHHRSDSARHAA